MLEMFWYISLLLMGVILGVPIGKNHKPQMSIHDKTSEEVREALYRSGLIKDQVSRAMVELRRIGVAFRSDN